MPKTRRLDDDLFFAICQANREYRIERTAEGDIQIIPPTGGQTGHRNTNLITDLNLWARRDAGGAVFDSSTGFDLPNGATRSPDVSWVRRERLARLSPAEKKAFLPLAPDFVIELGSPSDDLADLQGKMQEYQANGVRLGWLIVPARRQVYVYAQEAEVELLDNPQHVGGDPVLNGFVLELKRIWEPEF
jgi:Uma2 family endonuclease